MPDPITEIVSDLVKYAVDKPYLAGFVGGALWYYRRSRKKKKAEENGNQPVTHREIVKCIEGHTTILKAHSTESRGLGEKILEKEDNTQELVDILTDETKTQTAVFMSFDKKFGEYLALERGRREGREEAGG